MNILLNLLFLARGFLFPQKCALCGCSLTYTEEIRLGLCEKCRSAVSREKGQECNLCGKPLISEKELCLSCRNGGAHSYERMFVLFPYTGIYRKLLKAYKFTGNLSLANFFAEKIIELIQDNSELKDAYFVPVPPRPGKIKDTGWDQVEELIKRLKKSGREKIKVCGCLQRKISKVQKHLSRAERMENLKGRIMLKRDAPKVALVIDDVITTGSTMEVSCQALKDGGAEKVYGLCLFYD
uniref:Competence protein F-like protein n=1 Tax=uncultured bacterium contig00024 TaxID=1181513 RepID=A0A806JYN1_9BACT|nr:competence protein F-like protein [uncultured bacterium contig00024]